MRAVNRLRWMKQVKKRFDEIDAEVKKINKTIDRHILLAEHENCESPAKPGHQLRKKGKEAATVVNRLLNSMNPRKRAYLAYHTLQLMRGNAMGSAAIRDDAANNGWFVVGTTDRPRRKC